MIYAFKGQPWQPALRNDSDGGQVNALAMVAHDLRGPITSLSVLMDLIDTHGERHSSEGVSSCARRAQAILSSFDDMLTSLLTRVRATGDPLGFNPSRVDLNEVIARAVAQNQPVAEQQSVQLHWCSVAPLIAWGDQALLFQAVENIISNAVKYSGPDTHVTCQATLESGEAIIRISDQGPGLSADDINRAFRPFTKLTAKPADESRSWGLGLWIVKLIVERHGGSIEASSAGPDRGAVFTLRLPAKAA